MSRRIPCACGAPACRELIDPAQGRLYADGHRQRAHRREYAWKLVGPFWAGYRDVRRPARPRTV